MNFHINTKALEALSFADLEALANHLHNIGNLRNSSMAHVIPANFTIDACNELAIKVFNAKTHKTQKQGIITFFSGDSIEVKPITDKELTARTINAIRRHFGMNTHAEITVQHLKALNASGVEHVRGLGVACQREIEQCLKELGII
jgi:hypothetical protein